MNDGGINVFVGVIFCAFASAYLANRLSKKVKNLCQLNQPITSLNPKSSAAVGSIFHCNFWSLIENNRVYSSWLFSCGIKSQGKGSLRIAFVESVIRGRNFLRLKIYFRPKWSKTQQQTALLFVPGFLTQSHNWQGFFLRSRVRDFSMLL